MAAKDSKELNRTQRIRGEALLAYFAMDQSERALFRLQVRDPRFTSNKPFISNFQERGHEVRDGHINELRRLVADEMLNEFTDLVASAARLAKSHPPYRPIPHFSGTPRAEKLLKNPERPPAEDVYRPPVSIYPVMAAYYDGGKRSRSGFRAMLRLKVSSASAAIMLREVGYDVTAEQVEEVCRLVAAGELVLAE